MSWIEPSAVDDSGEVKLKQSSHKSGDTFHIGSTSVSYVFTDASNNTATCNFVVILAEEGKLGLTTSH